jgi:hypothetical protein
MKSLIHAIALSTLAVSTQAALSGGIGDLLVTPTRIVLDHRTHAAEIALINTGNSTATYRIEVQHMRMKENGDLAPVDEPADAFADAFVQFSPRRVVLEPHITQTVRLRMRPPSGKPATSELYLHLLFHGEPPADEAAAPVSDGKTLSIHLTPIYGVAVPIIVRLEETDASVRIDAIRMTAGAVAFQVARNGSCSTYGNIAVTFTPRGGTRRQVAAANGVSVYAPLAARAITLPLRLADGVALRDGSLQVSYVDAERNGALPTSATLALP